MSNKKRVLLKCAYGEHQPGDKPTLDAKVADAMIDRGDAVEFKGEATVGDEKIQTLTDEKAKLATKVQTLTDEKATLATQVQTLTDEKAELATQNQTLTDEKAELENGDVGLLKKEISTLKGKITNLNKKIEEKA